jgi:hypothetical protein
MRNLTLRDVRAALPDLIDDRAVALQDTHAGQIFLPAIENIRRKLDELPEGDDGDLVRAMALEDARHDGYAAAVWFQTEAYLRMPDLVPADRRDLETLRDAVLPRPSELSAPYAREAARAQERAAALHEPLKRILERYPCRGGLSLLDWMNSYLAAGERLQRLLSQRAVDKNFGEGYEAPLDAGRLRGRAVGLLCQLRETLQHELYEEPERWQQIDAAVFGYCDELSAAQASPGPWAEEDPLDKTNLYYGKRED